MPAIIEGFSYMPANMMVKKDKPLLRIDAKVLGTV
jgi:hypothetical protein